MAQNSKHLISRIQFLFEFWAISIIFRLKKWAISAKRHVTGILSHFQIEPSRFLMHITSRETCLLRWLLEPSQDTTVYSQYQYLNILQAIYWFYNCIRIPDFRKKYSKVYWFCSVGSRTWQSNSAGILSISWLFYFTTG